ncbi:MAG: hypothetical protein LQ340_007281 [Diploschistes diacapsis]|nr:MAG: hypothetical protein LQ340_007281 [Diploschistes diacapsis]
MSFATVAALPPKRIINQNAGSASGKAAASLISTSDSEKLALSSPSAKSHSEQDLSQSLSKLDMKSQPDPASDPAEHGPLEVLRQRANLEDEKTHLSVSSTKAPSLDGKSIASITTFAMDEKESIRPDDSASVQAAEDEDSNSGPGSGAQNSRFGSEAGAKAFHSQLQEISQQRGIPLPRKIGDAVTAAPLVNCLQQPLTISASPPNLGPQGAPMIPQYQFCAPDQKLLEALESAKDRLFLLQLEQQFIAFIQDLQVNSLDLPPYNSFFRLLAHRLGDYYRLSHWVDGSTNAVRLYKTNETHCAQLPTPLSAFSRKSSSDDAPSAAPSMKIMRRAGAAPSETAATQSGGNTNVNSMAPSKAGSETGDESPKVSGLASPAESSTAKDKATQTREEREAKYKEARERIFGDWKESDSGEANPSNEASTQASRASSVNGRKKKKSHKNNDDGFEVRSAYNVYYPNRQGPGFDQIGSPVGYYNPYMQQNGAQTMQPNLAPTFEQQYPPMQTTQVFAGQMVAQGQMPASNGILVPPGAQQQLMDTMGYQVQPQPMINQFYPQMQQPQNQMPFQPPMVPSPNSYNPQLSRPVSQISDQSWSQSSLQGPYRLCSTIPNGYPPQQPPSMQQFTMNSPNNMPMPYPYGQLPYQHHAPGNMNAHPVPGSYNRQTFNAQSQVFVPGASGYLTAGTDHSNRQNNNMTSPQGGSQGGMSFSYPMPQMPQNHLVSPLVASSSSSPRKVSNQSSQSQSPGASSTISKWGTPSTLPPKPPPPANQLMPSSMPTFQNGTYSQPVGASGDTLTH